MLTVHDSFGRTITVPIGVPRYCPTCNEPFREEPKVVGKEDIEGLSTVKVARACPLGHLWETTWHRPQAAPRRSLFPSGTIGEN